jgi:hypothetical protein
VEYSGRDGVLQLKETAMTSNPFLSAVAALSIVAWSFQALAQVSDRVEVQYLHPEKFADTGRYWAGEKARDVNLAELRKHLEGLAARLVPQGQALSVLVTELDMAGGFEPWRAGLGDIRIIRATYPPRIDLSFKLTASDGSVLKQGERRLRDPFMIGGLQYRGDRLRYEKGLLDDWMEGELRP